MRPIDGRPWSRAGEHPGALGVSLAMPVRSLSRVPVKEVQNNRRTTGVKYPEGREIENRGPSMTFDELERHPLSEVWGDMPPDDFAALVESVEADGFTDPRIMVYKNQVLDGWHRYRAARRLAMIGELEFEEYEGEDPVAFVVNRNAHRRHLTQGQIAQIIVKIRPQRPWGLQPGQEIDPETGQFTGAATVATPVPATQEEIAADAGVSDRTLRNANAIEDAGLGDEVRSGEMGQREALNQARGDDTEKPPTPMERLRAQVDALNLDLRQKDDAIEFLESRLRFIQGEGEPVEAKREEVFNSMRAEIQSLRASRDEWMAKHDEELRSRRYWEREAKARGWQPS